MSGDGVPFVLYGIWKDLIFSAIILLALALFAVFFGPFGPTGVPDPTIIQTGPMGSRKDDQISQIANDRSAAAQCRGVLDF